VSAIYLSISWLVRRFFSAALEKAEMKRSRVASALWLTTTPEKNQYQIDLGAKQKNPSRDSVGKNVHP
jgi:hypothetical protein